MTHTKPVSSPGTERNNVDSRQPQILLAEDTDEMRTVVAMRLRQQGYGVTECRDGAELISELSAYLRTSEAAESGRHYDLIISDIRMPGVFGLSIAEGAAECSNFPPTILITAFGDDETHEKARQFGVTAVIDKPFDMNELLGKVQDALSGAASA